MGDLGTAQDDDLHFDRHTRKLLLYRADTPKVFLAIHVVRRTLRLTDPLDSVFQGSQ